MATYQEWLAEQNRLRQQAQGQLASAQSNALNTRPVIGSQGMGRSFSTSRIPTQDFTAVNNANARLADVQGRISALDPNAPENRAEGNRLQAYDLARGGVDRLANDPTDAFIRQRLMESAQTGAGPYDATTRNAMFTNAMESSGADAQAQSIMESAAQRGMSANDPSVQAALRRVQDQQAQGAQRARLGIDLEANRANYGAQQSAVNRLGDYNQSRQGQMQSAEDRLREMLWNEGINRGVAGPQVTMPNFGGGGNPPPGPAPAPAPAPQPRFAPTPAPQRGGGLTPANGIVGRPVGQVQVGTTTPGVGRTTSPVPSPSMWTARGPAATITGYNPVQQPAQTAQAQPQRPLPGGAPSRQVGPYRFTTE